MGKRVSSTQVKSDHARCLDEISRIPDLRDFRAQALRLPLSLVKMIARVTCMFAASVGLEDCGSTQGQASAFQS
jgi:hypothetical protein